MNVKELRELASQIPNGLTQEEFDSLPAMMIVDGRFYSVDDLSILEKLTPLGEDGKPEKKETYQADKSIFTITTNEK